MWHAIDIFNSNQNNVLVNVGLVQTKEWPGMKRHVPQTVDCQREAILKLLVLSSCVWCFSIEFEESFDSFIYPFFYNGCSHNRHNCELSWYLDFVVVAFRMYDLDGDGCISREELLAVLHMMVGANISEEQVSMRCLGVHQTFAVVIIVGTRADMMALETPYLYAVDIHWLLPHFCYLQIAKLLT